MYTIPNIFYLSGVIGYFRLCRPQQNPFGNGFGNQYNSGGFPQYSAHGVGVTGYQHQHYDSTQMYREDPNFAKPYGDYYGKSQMVDNNANIRFGDAPQNLAYQGYSQYRSNENKVEQK